MPRKLRKPSAITLNALIVVLAVATPLAGMRNARARTNSDGGATQAPSASSAPVAIGKVRKVVHPEHAVSTVDERAVKHASPAKNAVGLLRNIPGFNVVAQGPGNLTPTDTIFTLNGFTSDQLGTTFDGVPVINLGRGGFYGQGDDHAITPLTIGQISNIKVFSGSNTPAQNSVDSLGGTVEFVPKMPSKEFGIDLTGEYSSYQGGGNVDSLGVALNSGSIQKLNGFRSLVSFQHIRDKSFQEHAHAIVNSSYAALLQPFNSGLSKLSLILTNNSETGTFPDMVPQPLLDKYGANWTWPTDVATNMNSTRSTNVIVGLNTFLNNYMQTDFKFFVNDNRNDRTAYANPAYNNVYQGYGLPTYLKSCSALDGYGSNYDTYNSTAAQNLFGSCEAGTAYQRYVDDYTGVGGKGELSLLLPHNTVTAGGMLEHFHDTSREFWYGSFPVPTTIGYNNAWYEQDNVFYVDGFIQDDIAFAGNAAHLYPGVKLVRDRVGATDTQGYYYGYAGNVAKTYTFTEPSLGFRYDLSKALELYVNYGRTQKAPNVSALYSLIGYGPVAQPVTVNPEYVNSLDAGIRYASDWGKVKLAVFQRQFSDIFSYYYNDQTGQTFEYNAGSARYRGFTVSLEKEVLDGLGVFANYGYTQAIYTTNFTGNNGTVTSGQDRPNVPKYTANLGAAYEHGPLYFSLSDHLVGSQYLAYSSGETSNTQLGTYQVWDALASYEWHPSGGVSGIKLEAFVDNLLNKQYNIYAYIHGSSTSTGNYQLSAPGAPRTIGLRVKVSF